MTEIRCKYLRILYTVSNGPKEQLGAGEGAAGSEEFEPWRSQQQNSAAHTPYGASVPISSATDIYSMSTAGTSRKIYLFISKSHFPPKFVKK